MEDDLAIKELSAAEIAAAHANDHVADVVEALNLYEPKKAAEILGLLPPELAGDVLDQPALDNPEELIPLLQEAKAVALLEAMAADRRADIFRELPEPPREALLSRLSPEARAAVTDLLTFPEGSAGSIMTTEFVSVPSNFTVGRTLEHIRRVERTRETIYSIYVLDPRSRRLVNAVTLRQLIAGDLAAPILSVGPQRKPVTVTALMDQEVVARLISKYDLLALPVVDTANHVIGIVTVDDIIDAIVDEGTEDAQKFGGTAPLDEPYMEIGLLGMLKKRAGWLSILFLAEMLTAWAMQYFQAELEKAIVLALFIPLVMSSGGNSGSQATSLIIRALALDEIRLRDWWRVALRELPTGALLGTILGIIAVIRIVAWQWFGFFDYGQHWPRLAVAIGLALVGIVTFGSLAGAMLPFALKRVGFDPASASAPFVATLVDVTGLVIYFTVAVIVLHGTLL
jgi:magnesium transporter